MYGKEKRLQIAKAIFRKKNAVGGINLPDFRLYYNTTVIKTVWYWHKNRNANQRNKRKSPEINPRTFGYHTFDKGNKNIQWRKYTFFNKWCWENWTAKCKRMKLEPFLTPYTKINSKWVKDLKTRNYKTLNRKTSRSLYDINCSKILYDPLPRIMETKAKIHKWDIIKLKGFCTAKKIIYKMKRQPSEWEKSTANEATDTKDSLPKYACSSCSSV